MVEGSNFVLDGTGGGGGGFLSDCEKEPTGIVFRLLSKVDCWKPSKSTPLLTDLFDLVVKLSSSKVTQLFGLVSDSEANLWGNDRLFSAGPKVNTGLFC